MKCSTCKHPQEFHKGGDCPGPEELRREAAKLILEAEILEVQRLLLAEDYERILAL